MSILKKAKSLVAKIYIGAHIFVPRLQTFATRPNSRPTLVVQYRDPAGKRDRISAVDRDKLVERLTVLVNGGCVSQREAKSITADTIGDAQKYRDLERRARAHGISAAEAVDMTVASIDILKGRYRPETACRFYMESVATGFTPTRVGQVVCQLILHKRGQKKAEESNDADAVDQKKRKSYFIKVRYLLVPFARHFRGRLFDEIKASEMRSWLDGLNLKDENYNNYRGALKLLSNFAEAQHVLPRNRKHEINYVERKRITRKEPPVLDPKDLRILLAEVYDLKLILWIVIKAFSGGRTCEVKLLDWWHLLNRNEINYDVKIVKKYTQARYVPIQPVLAAWLKPFWQDSGLICPGSETEDEVISFASSLNIKLLRNILRKTYVALRMTVLKNSETVTYEMGEQKPVMYRHYNSSRSKEMAAEHWNLFPPPDWDTRWEEILEERRAAAEKRKQQTSLSASA